LLWLTSGTFGYQDQTGKAKKQKLLEGFPVELENSC